MQAIIEKGKIPAENMDLKKIHKTLILKDMSPKWRWLANLNSCSGKINSHNLRIGALKERLVKFKNLYPDQESIDEVSYDKLKSQTPSIGDLVVNAITGFIPAYDFLTDFLFVLMIYYTFQNYREQ